MADLLVAGKASWTASSPSWEEVNGGLAAAIMTWTLEEELNFLKLEFNMESEKMDRSCPPAVKLLGIWTVSAFLKTNPGTVEIKYFFSCILTYIFVTSRLHMIYETAENTKPFPVYLHQ